MQTLYLCDGPARITNEFPAHLPEKGFVWISLARREFEVQLSEVQTRLQGWMHAEIHDLHVQDLLSSQLPSHFDYSSDYSFMVFRRLAAGKTESDISAPGTILYQERNRSLPSILRHINTSPIGFLVFDRLLLTVHPTNCAVREQFVQRLMGPSGSLSVQHRTLLHPADLMLRLVGHAVDSYQDLRKELTRQLDHWQSQLLNPVNRFDNWASLLDTRMTLHHLDETCEDQRACMQDWIAMLEVWSREESMPPKTLEQLNIRSRDVLERIERVVHHVNRLEQSSETAIQMHFNVQSNRTNEIMRTLTVLTAVFLPLNLVTGFFGMNFENFPFLHTDEGLLVTEMFMLVLVVVMVWIFWRKRYLPRK
jgi:Mg2+ and Co2+ transporter CorA